MKRESGAAIFELVALVAVLAIFAFVGNKVWQDRSQISFTTHPIAIDGPNGNPATATALPVPVVAKQADLTTALSTVDQTSLSDVNSQTDLNDLSTDLSTF